MSDPLTSTVSPRRLVSLDVLRGLAILLMIGSGMLPKTLPNWVDHGYQPHYRPDAAGAWHLALTPEGDAIVDPRWKAMTWVDLVFPMFLFAMGAAIPLAMSRRLDRGQSRGGALRSVAGRAVTLALFAVLVTQMTAWQLNWPGTTPDATRGRVMLGFVGAFLFFVRWPREATRMTVIVARAIGAAILVGLIVLGVRRGAPFNWGESDTIILVLANTYLIAAGLWVVTRGWGGWRLVAIAPFILLAHYLQLQSPTFSDWRWLGDAPLALAPYVAWPSRVLNLAQWLPAGASKQLKDVLNFSPLWGVTWYKFLWCVVPGTIVGDAIGAWSKRPRTNDAPPRGLILGLAIAICVATFVGLRHYGFPTLGFAGAMRTPWLAAVLALPLLIAMTIVVFARSTDATHRWLMRVGAAALCVGLALACLPNATAREGFFEGGISKGSPATLSYYATSVGLCIVLLLGLLVMIDDRPRHASSPGVLEANGQNPMLAYFLAHSTLPALFTFSCFASLSRTLSSNVWIETSYGLAKTLLIAAVVWLVTRRRIFWRA